MNRWTFVNSGPMSNGQQAQNNHRPDRITKRVYSVRNPCKGIAHETAEEICQVDCEADNQAHPGRTLNLVIELYSTLRFGLIGHRKWLSNAIAMLFNQWLKMELVYAGANGGRSGPSETTDWTRPKNPKPAGDCQFVRLGTACLVTWILVEIWH
jgi:hypothetical protein